MSDPLAFLQSLPDIEKTNISASSDPGSEDLNNEILVFAEPQANEEPPIPMARILSTALLEETATSSDPEEDEAAVPRPKRGRRKSPRVMARQKATELCRAIWRDHAQAQFKILVEMKRQGYHVALDKISKRPQDYGCLSGTADKHPAKSVLDESYRDWASFESVDTSPLLPTSPFCETYSLMLERAR